MGEIAISRLGVWEEHGAVNTTLALESLLEEGIAEISELAKKLSSIMMDLIRILKMRVVNLQYICKIRLC
jgi:hypothetical protein